MFGLTIRIFIGIESVFDLNLVISGGCKVVCAFGWCEGIEGFGDCAPEIVDGSGGGFSEQGFELREGHLASAACWQRSL